MASSFNKDFLVTCELNYYINDNSRSSFVVCKVFYHHCNTTMLGRKYKSTCTGNLCMQPEMQGCGKETMKLIEKGWKLTYVYKKVRTGI